MAGVSLLAISWFLNQYLPKSFSGVCIGVGASLLGLSISRFIMLRHDKLHPEESKMKEIELSDERNIIIRDKAKARVSEIIQWMTMIVAYINILVDGELWITLTLVGLFLFKTVLDFYFMTRYQKIM